MKTYPYKKIIAITDIHFGVHSNSFEWFDRQYDYFKSFLIPILKDEESRNPGENVLWILGDIFDSRQSLNLRIAWEVKKLFLEISQIMPIHILVGNHDIYYLDSNDVTSVDFLADTNDRIQVWKNPEVVKYHNTTMLIMPWRKSKQDIEECVNTHNADWLLCHCDINELKTNSKSIPVDYGVSPKIFEKFKRVLSGHIHFRQKHRNILMLGNNQHTTRADLGNDKFVDFFDLTQSYDKCHSEIINTHSPRFVKFNVTELLAKTKDELKRLTTNQLVDVEIDNTYLVDNSVKCNVILKEIEEYAKELKSFVVYASDDTVIELNDNVVQTYDINVIIETFIDKMEYSDEIKERAKKEAKEIIQELKEVE